MVRRKRKPQQAEPLHSGSEGRQSMSDDSSDVGKSDIGVEEKYDKVYTVEKILRARKVKGKQQYYIKWEGYGSEYNEWLHEDDILDPLLIEEYEENNKKKNKKRRKKGTSKKRKANVVAVAADDNDDDDDDETPWRKRKLRNNNNNSDSDSGDNTSEKSTLIVRQIQKQQQQQRRNQEQKHVSNSDAAFYARNLARNGYWTDILNSRVLTNDVINSCPTNSRERYSLLHYAVLKRAPCTIIQGLLKKGADTSLVNSMNETALDMAVNRKYNEIVNILLNYTI